MLHVDGELEVKCFTVEGEQEVKFFTVEGEQEVESFLLTFWNNLFNYM